jgi:hypothetical protein
MMNSNLPIPAPAPTPTFIHAPVPGSTNRENVDLVKKMIVDLQAAQSAGGNTHNLATSLLALIGRVQSTGPFSIDAIIREANNFLTNAALDAKGAADRAVHMSFISAKYGQFLRFFAGSTEEDLANALRAGQILAGKYQLVIPAGLTPAEYVGRAFEELSHRGIPVPQ